MKFSDLEKDVPVELMGILGDETVESGDEPLGLEALVEGITGVSLSPYSQQKLMLSHETVGTSDREPMFEQIFGEGVPQSDFLKGAIDNEGDLLTLQVPPRRKIGFIERVMDQAESSADPHSRKILGAFVQKMKDSVSTKFLLQKMEQGDPFVALSDAECDELNRLRIIDTERFDCAFPSPL
jgi:hypothetical protein